MKKLLLLLTVVLLGSAAAWAQTQTQAIVKPTLGQSTTFKVTPSGGTGTYSTTFFVVGGSSTDVGLTSTNLIAEAKLSSSAATTGDFTATETENQTETPAGSGTWVKNGTFDATVDGSDHKFTVTWNGGSSAEFFYVFAKTNDGCADNYRAWKVMPQASPWYITNVELATLEGETEKSPGVLLDEGICPSSDITATFSLDGNTPPNAVFTYDYGISAMYIKVTADGTLGGGEWTPSITLVHQDATKLGKTGNTGDKTSTLALEAALGQTLEAITYTTVDVPNYDKDNDPTTPNTDAELLALYSTAITDATTEKTIYIRIPISNKQWAALTEQGYSIYVDGKDGNAVVDGTSSTGDGFDTTNDVINQTINARPTVVTTAP